VQVGSAAPPRCPPTALCGASRRSTTSTRRGGGAAEGSPHCPLRPRRGMPGVPAPRLPWTPPARHPHNRGSAGRGVSGQQGPGEADEAGSTTPVGSPGIRGLLDAGRWSDLLRKPTRPPSKTRASRVFKPLDFGSAWEANKPYDVMARGADYRQRQRVSETAPANWYNLGDVGSGISVLHGERHLAGLPRHPHRLRSLPPTTRFEIVVADGLLRGLAAFFARLKTKPGVG